jgi:hypothetical protein
MKPAAGSGPVEMLPSPRDPRRAKYQWWALAVWVIGLIVIMIKWWKY